MRRWEGAKVFPPQGQPWVAKRGFYKSRASRIPDARPYLQSRHFALFYLFNRRLSSIHRER